MKKKREGRRGGGRRRAEEIGDRRMGRREEARSARILAQGFLTDAGREVHEYMPPDHKQV